MQDFIILMHDDAPSPPKPEQWPAYFASLNALGVFDGGSAIGGGETFRKNAPPAALTAALGGYIRIRAEGLAEARVLLAGNPVYEGGGTVEIRELPRD